MEQATSGPAAVDRWIPRRPGEDRTHVVGERLERVDRVRPGRTSSDPTGTEVDTELRTRGGRRTHRDRLRSPTEVVGEVVALEHPVLFDHPRHFLADVRPQDRSLRTPRGCTAPARRRCRGAAQRRPSRCRHRSRRARVAVCNECSQTGDPIAVERCRRGRAIVSSRRSARPAACSRSSRSSSA